MEPSTNYPPVYDTLSEVDAYASRKAPVISHAPVHPRVAPTSPRDGKLDDAQERASKKYYILPGISERSKLQHESLPGKNYDYHNMFHTMSPPMPDMVNTCYRYFYDVVGQLIYYLLAFIFAPILLLVLGLLSGILNFIFAWIMSPFYNCAEVTIPRCSRPLKVTLQHCVAPFFVTVGGIFSSIRINHTKMPVHDSTTASIA